MNRFVSPFRNVRCWLALGLVVASCGQIWANQSTDNGSAGGVLPPLPIGSGADGKAQPELADRAVLEKMVRDLSVAGAKPKVAVLEALVTIDGVPRPDLGAVFSDTLTAKLLNAGAYEVVDASALGAANGQALDLANHTLDAKTGLGTSAATAYEFGKVSGADYVIVPTVIGIQGDFRVSLRKLKLPGGRIEKIVQETVRGDQRSIFTLAERCAAQMAPEPAADGPAKPYDPPFTSVRAWMTPPVKQDPMQAAATKAPKALKGNGSLANVVSQIKVEQAFSEAGVERQLQRLGQILTVDPRWCFCEFTSPAGTMRLKDQVFAWSGGATDHSVTLTVSRIEGNRVIAEFDDTDPRKQALRPGLSIYQWKTPAK